MQFRLDLSSAAGYNCYTMLEYVQGEIVVGAVA